jgi:hypothetical protein
MGRICQAIGCGKSTSSKYSLYCSPHKTRRRRHGDVMQEAVSSHDLAPYLKLVSARVERNPESLLWAKLEERWEVLIVHAKSLVAASQRMAMNKYERKAAEELVKLSEHVKAQEVIHTALALFILQDQRPREFRSDQAFRCQLVRRVRALTDMNVGTWWDHKANKVKRVYRDLPIKCTSIIGQWLAEAFGGAGLRLAELERADLQKQREAVADYHRALEELT